MIPPSAHSGQASGLDEMVQRGPGDVQNFRDRRFRDGFGQEALNLGFPTRQLRCPEDPFGPPRQPSLGLGHG